MNTTKTIKKSSLAPTVLLSGIGGFIALHLARALLLKNCRVVVAQKVLSNDKKVFADLLRDPKFALFDLDVNEGIPAKIESVDYAIHFSNVYPEPAGTVDLDNLVLSTVGVKNVLDLSNASQAKFCLIAPAFVSEKPLYSSERISEKELEKLTNSLVWEYYNKWLVDVRVVRVPYVYGPEMDLATSAYLGMLVEELKNQSELTISDDGSQKENYLFISDAVSGILKALFSNRSKGKDYTLISGKAHTLLETAYIARSLADAKVDLRFEENTSELRINRDSQTFDKVEMPEGWVAKVGLKEGFIKTLKSFGYNPNPNTFKAANLIDQKNAEKEFLDSIATIAQKQLETPISLPVVENRPARTKVRPSYFLNRFVFFSGLAKAAAKKFKSKNLYRFKMAGLSAFVILAFVGVFTLVPLFQGLKNSYQAFTALEQYQTELLKLNTAEAKKLSNTAYINLTKAQKAYARIGWAYKLIGKKDQYDSSSAFLQSGIYFSRALYNLSLGLEPVSGVWDSMRPQSGTYITAADFEKSHGFLLKSRQDINLAAAQLKNVEKEKLPSKVRGKFDLYQQALVVLDSESDFLNQALLDFPQLLGLKGEKTYLVLFQNQNELRPTGGFIGSYATVTLNKGKIEKIEIDDIYNPDGQLLLKEDKTLPPAEIAKYLGEEQLFIRNANWDPDFKKSSEKIKQLFRTSTGVSYDGVFAVDLEVVKRLLDVLGPVYLPAYEEEISASNLFERAQFHSDFDYKEGESSKKAFLTVLGGKILERLFSVEDAKLPGLFNVLSSSTAEKHLLSDLSGSYLAQYFADKGWDGSLAKTTGDYLYVVDANVGGTKANYFVSQEMSYGVTSETRDGLLRGSLEIVYTHSGKGTDWLGGPYKDYVRVYTQKGAKLTGAWLFADDRKDNSDGDILKDVVISETDSHTVFGTFFTLEPQRKTRLVLEYDLPKNLSITKESQTYSLYWQKQPGTLGHKTKFLFSAPFGMNFVESPDPSFVSGSVFDYRFDLTKDQTFNFLLK